jgi:hypothetical protein
MVSKFDKKHGERFEKDGCMVETKNSFYVGYDFSVNRIAELCFFEHLQKSALKLKLKPSSKVINELTKTKKYGLIKKILKRNNQMNAIKKSIKRMRWGFEP